MIAVHGALSIVVNGVLPRGRGPGDGVIGYEAPGTGLGTALTPALVSGRNEVAVEVVPLVRRPGAVTGGAVSARGEPDGLDFGPVRFAFRVVGPDGETVPGTERPVAASDSAFGAWTRAFAARWPAWRAAEDSAYAVRPALRDSLTAVLASDHEAAWGGRGPALDSARAWARANPVRVEASFTRPGGTRPTDGQPSFDEVIRDAPVIRGTAADSARLRAFAVELLRLVETRDGATLYDLFATEVRDRLAVTGRAPPPADTMRALWADIDERDGPFGLAEVAPFKASDVVLTSWASGRIWELSLLGQQSLLVHPEVAAGRNGPVVRVYVGEGPDGALRVVR